MVAIKIPNERHSVLWKVEFNIEESPRIFNGLSLDTHLEQKFPGIFHNTLLCYKIVPTKSIAKKQTFTSTHLFENIVSASYMVTSSPPFFIGGCTRGCKAGAAQNFLTELHSGECDSGGHS